MRHTGKKKTATDNQGTDEFGKELVYGKKKENRDETT